ncbi:hypothetical protein EON64_08800 [archaeon]|nr:MAG: hypothetical protein EON64_08800 [archaeon]
MSILSITPFNEEYKDEQDEEVANMVIEKIKKETVRSAHISLHTSSSFDPAIMCLLAIRQQWYATHPTCCYLLPLFASIVSVSQGALACYLFFGSVPPRDNDDWWADLNILSRGAQDGYMSFTVLRSFCQVLLVCWQLPDLIKVIGDLQVQIYVLEPLEPEHNTLPIISAIGLILDLFSVTAMLLAGLVYLSEVQSPGNTHTTSDLLASLSLLTVLGMYRKCLSHCAMSVISVLLNDATLAQDALTFLKCYRASTEEKARMATSASWRTRSLLVFCVVVLLALAFLIYELYCSGVFQSCVYDI